MINTDDTYECSVYHVTIDTKIVNILYIKNRLDFKEPFLRQTGNEILGFLESKEFARLDKDSFNTIIEQKDVTLLLVNIHLFVRHLSWYT